MCSSGMCCQWFKEGDAAAGFQAASGPLLEALLKTTEYIDTRCVDLLREGASMFDALVPSGVGTPNACEETKNASALRDTCSLSNARLLESLRTDPHAEELLEITKEDARLGRISASLGRRNQHKRRAPSPAFWCLASEGRWFDEDPSC